MLKIPVFFQKPRPVYHHILAASIIVAYWWALWNIFDALFLANAMNHTEVISVLIVAGVSLALMFILDVDFSDL